MKLCDFCNEIGTRVYRTKDNSEVHIKFFTESGPLIQTHVLTKDWQACEECGNLIDQGKWNAITVRVMSMMTLQDIPPVFSKNFLDQTYDQLKAAGLQRIQ